MPHTFVIANMLLIAIVAALVSGYLFYRGLYVLAAYLRYFPYGYPGDGVLLPGGLGCIAAGCLCLYYLVIRQL